MTMTRRLRQWTNPRRTLPLAAAVLTVSALAPVRATRWTEPIADLAITLLAPVSGPTERVGRWLKPASRRPPAPEQIRELEEERARFELLWLQERRRLEQFRRQVEQMQLGMALNPDLAVRQIVAPVIGTSSDLTSGLLRVRAGREHGVEINTVVCVQGVQLLGRVVRVAERHCVVRPITDSSSPRLEGVILVGAGAQERQLACSLEPAGDGTLRGRVEWVVDEQLEPLDVPTGSAVRLADDSWPANAQMLLIGTVARVEPAPDQPLRRQVTVRPGVRLDRVREVQLRITPEPEADTAGAGP